MPASYTPEEIAIIEAVLIDEMPKAWMLVPGPYRYDPVQNALIESAGLGRVAAYVHWYAPASILKNHNS